MCCFSLFLSPEWVTLRTQGVLPSIFLPDYSLASLHLLIYVLVKGRATASREIVEEFGDLLRLLHIELVIVENYCLSLIMPFRMTVALTARPLVLLRPEVSSRIWYLLTALTALFSCPTDCSSDCSTD